MDETMTMVMVEVTPQNEAIANEIIKLLEEAGLVDVEWDEYVNQDDTVFVHISGMAVDDRVLDYTAKFMMPYFRRIITTCLPLGLKWIGMDGRSWNESSGIISHWQLPLPKAVFDANTQAYRRSMDRYLVLSRRANKLGNIGAYDEAVEEMDKALAILDQIIGHELSWSNEPEDVILISRKACQQIRDLWATLGAVPPRRLS